MPRGRKRKSLESEPKGDDPFVFEGPGNFKVTLPKETRFAKEQTKFIRIFCRFWRGGSLAFFDSMLASQPWAGLPEPKSRKVPTSGLAVAQGQAALAFAIIMARSPACTAFMALRRGLNIEEIPVAIELCASLCGREIQLFERPALGRLLLNCIIRSAFTRRAIADLLQTGALTRLEFAQIIKRRKEKKNPPRTKYSDEQFNLWNPRVNLDFAIAVLWSAPGVWLFREIGNRAKAYRAFMQNLQPLNPPPIEAWSYNRFYIAAQRLGLIEKTERAAMREKITKIT